jgi:hypothetical protein
LTLLTIAVPTVSAPGSLFTSLEICRQQIDALSNPDEVELLVSVNNLEEISDATIGKIELLARVVRNNGSSDYDSHIEFLVTSSRGQFVKLLADDDFLKPGSLNAFLQAVKSSPDTSFFYHEFDFTTGQSHLQAEDYNFYTQTSAKESIKKSVSWGQVSAVLVKRSDWSAIPATVRTNYVHIYKLLYTLFAADRPSVAHSSAKLVTVTLGSPNFSKSAFQRASIGLSGLRVHHLLQQKFPNRAANLTLANRQMVLLARILAHSKATEQRFSSLPFLIALAWFPLLPASLMLLSVAAIPSIFLRFLRSVVSREKPANPISR